MMFFWFLFLIPLAIFLVARPGAMAGGCCMPHATQDQPPVTPGNDPVEIVRQRLARGEITAAEYEQIRKALQG